MTRAGIQRRDRTWLVAVAASLWGLSGLLREPLSHEMSSSTLVLVEHVVLVVLVSPWLVPAFRAWAASPLHTKLAATVIGVGSSALATVMFTAAFRLGDPVTPQVLQKVQPVLAIVLAAAFLGERPTGRFPWLAVPALAGAWLLAFPNPLGVAVDGGRAALLALGAASLWALGTVLGRVLSTELSFMHVTALRFAFGFAALTGFAVLRGDRIQLPVDSMLKLILLALGPGLLALVLYTVPCAIRLRPGRRSLSLRFL